MKIKYEFITSILALLSPILTVVALCFVEPELNEAVLGGLIIGCIIGSAFGVISLLINKSKSKTGKVLSIIPMCPLVLYLLMLIPA